MSKVFLSVMYGPPRVSIGCNRMPCLGRIYLLHFVNETVGTVLWDFTSMRTFLSIDTLSNTIMLRLSNIRLMHFHCKFLV